MDEGDTQPPPSPSPSPFPSAGSGEKEVVLTSWAVLILVSLLLTSLSVSYLLERRRVRRIFMHESIVAIAMGTLVGLVVRLYGNSELKSMMSFDHRCLALTLFCVGYFFNLLLPPIILNSGYDLKPKSFFRNFGSILTFAFLGTLIGSFVIGVLLYLVSVLRLTIPLTFLDCMIFGSLLSSTDPVTIIAIFNQLKSLLNDAVATVLFTTLLKFTDQEASLASVLAGTTSFITVFSGSVLIGTLIALITSLILKHSHLHKHPALESCIITLLAYSSYLLSNSIHLSGIVSLLFASIVMKHYVYNNMSVRTRRTTKYMFRVLSQLSENFIFMYLDVTLFAKAGLVFSPVFCCSFFFLWSIKLFLTIILIVMVSRYASTIPVSTMLNRLNPLPNGQLLIPTNHQCILWWAGLRGAIAFALSFEMDASASAPAIRTTTLIVCVVSIVGLGGTEVLAIEELGVRTGAVEEDEDASSGDEENDWDDEIALVQGRGRRLGSDASGVGGKVPVGLSANGRVRAVSEDAMRVGGFDVRGSGNSWQRMRSDHSLMDGENDDELSQRMVADDHWFIGFGNRWMKPLFTRSRVSRRVQHSPGIAGRDSPSRLGLLETGRLRMDDRSSLDASCSYTFSSKSNAPSHSQPSKIVVEIAAWPSSSSSSSAPLVPSQTKSPIRATSRTRKAVKSNSESSAVSSLTANAWKNLISQSSPSYDDGEEQYMGVNGKSWSRKNNDDSD
ncbi:Sodium/hydrogen exchanger family-domain-containing protein [Chytriomyces cf. hyalinus JEL632]|nr:Sodium/hydrogen exchanger family-domain-containing protein [Chytriomyces cf. hyalinus JEL632]